MFTKRLLKTVIAFCKAQGACSIEKHTGGVKNAVRKTTSDLIQLSWQTADCGFSPMAHRFTKAPTIPDDRQTLPKEYHPLHHMRSAQQAYFVHTEDYIHR